MKVTRDDLIQATKVAKVATDGIKGTTDAHKCFQLQIKDGKLCVSACGPAQIFAEVIIVADDVSTWTPVLVNADIFSNLVSRIDGLDILEITQDMEDGICKKITISGKGSKMALNTVQTDFPEKETWEESLFDGTIKCLDETKQVMHAAGMDSTENTILQNIHMILGIDGGYKIEALDGNRISIRRQEYDKERNIEFLINSILASRALKMMSGKECALKVDAHKCAFSTEDMYIQCPISRQKYPVTDKMYTPSLIKTELTFDKEELISNIELAMVYGNRQNLKVENGVCTLLSKDPNLGHMDLRPSCKVMGEDVSIKFNALYLLDAIKSLPGEEIRIKLIDSKTPFFCGDDFKMEIIAPVGNK